MDYKKNLKKIREEKGINKAKLGKLIGKDGSYINKIEEKNISPTIDTILLICEALNITPNELIGINNLNILPKEEKELIEQYRLLTEREKGKIEYVLSEILKEKETSSTGMGKSSGLESAG